MGICILGQGDCDSVNTVDITSITNNDININNSIKNIINQNCNTITSQSNVVNIVGSKVVRLNASQKNSIDSLCILQSVLDSSISNDVQQNLLDKIRTNLESKGGLLGSPAKNLTISKNITTNAANIDNSKFNEVTKNCILDTRQENLLNIISSEVEDSNIDQVNNSFLKCMSEHSDITKVTADAILDTQQEEEISATAQSGDIGASIGTAAQGIGSGIGTAAQGLGSIISAYMYPIIIIAVVLVIASLIISVFSLQNPEAASSLGTTASGLITSYKNT